jgi:cytidylate kinase
MDKLCIALDGPAGAGKSTVAKKIAGQLKINYLDTGAMYRALAYTVLSQGLDPNNKNDVLNVLDRNEISVGYTEEVQRVYVNNNDVTDQIRTPEVGNGASAVAIFPEVRLKLVEIQRQVARQYDTVMDGRDICTFVMPHTKNKFFITASTGERARRRHLEFLEKGINKPLGEIENEIIARDKNDSERAFAPLRRAEDAILVDTTDMTIEDVTGYILERIIRD